MIEQLDTVVLLPDASEYDLERGDIGVVVHRYSRDANAYEVEFVTGEGETVAVLTLDSYEIRHGPARASACPSTGGICSSRHRYVGALYRPQDVLVFDSRQAENLRGLPTVTILSFPCNLGSF